MISGWYRKNSDYTQVAYIHSTRSDDESYRVIFYRNGVYLAFQDIHFDDFMSIKDFKSGYFLLDYSVHRIEEV